MQKATFQTEHDIEKKIEDLSSVRLKKLSIAAVFTGVSDRVQFCHVLDILIRSVPFICFFPLTGPRYLHVQIFIYRLSFPSFFTEFSSVI